MKRLKRIMALVIAMAMVVALALPAMADTTGAPTKGSITVNSPIVGATYKIYKVFDMTTNKAEDAFSYTIDTNSPFYAAVSEYAENKANGLILTPIASEHVDDDTTTEDDESYDKFNVSVSEKAGDVEGYGAFDAQAFGKAMQAVLAGSPAVTDPETGDVITPAVPAINADAEKTVATSTDDTSDYVKFEDVPLGYYLINPTYPEADAKTITLGEGANAKTFSEADLETETNQETGETTIKEPKALNDEAKTKVSDYVKSVIGEDINDAKFKKYLTDNGITTNKDGSPLNDAGRQVYYNELKAAMEKDATDKILAVFNSENWQESDINVKEPILVFVDSSKPDAVINEKNELDKWDVPVNPQAGVQPGQPDHGEPEGGKNIIVQEATEDTPAYSADWSEANTGESVHYQLRVNAMNFIRTGEDDKTIEQVKEYMLADYNSAQMHFDQSKGLRVSIWQGDNKNNSQGDGTTNGAIANVTKNVGLGENGINGAAYVANDGDPYIDYTSFATGTMPNTFFKNGTNADGKASDFDTDTHSVFNDGTGIVVPWVFVYDPSTVADDPATENKNESEEALAEKISQYPIYTVTNVPVEGEYEKEEVKTDSEGAQVPYKVTDPENGGWKVVPGQFVSVNGHVVDTNGCLLDADGNPIGKTKPIYTFSIYNSDVTIVVDYWMILDDDAIVDEPGNKNFAQYGWNPIDNKDTTTGKPKTPTDPDETDKPSKKEKVDEATVYTFALAWVKIDEQGNELADAEFELPFYVKPAADGKDNDTYVFLVSKAAIEAAKAAVEAAEGDEKTAAQAELDRLNALKAQGTDKVTTTTLAADGEKGVITIKGVEQGKYSITETKAPAGFNKLEAPFTVEAKKSGPEVTTTTKTTIYYDAQGNVTNEVTNISKEYKTDQDSFNNADQSATNEEKSVPVFEYKHVVNKQGTELPSTGGIGTAIFYVVGAILVIGAGVILITRRRMDA